MSFTTYMVRVKRGTVALDRGHGLGSFLVGRGERYSSNAFFSFLKGAYREKTLLWGKIPLDGFVGAISTALGGLLEVYAGMHGQRSQLGGHLVAVGDGAMMSYIGSHATAAGAKWKKRQVLVLPEGAAAPANLPPGTQMLGELPEAVSGAYLSDMELARYRQPR